VCSDDIDDGRSVMPDPRVTAPPVHRREELARAWTRSATTATYIARSATDLEALLLELVDALMESLGSDDFTLSAGTRIGARLVKEGFVDPAALAVTVEVLSDGLLGDMEQSPDTELSRRTIALLGALSAGYAAGLRSHTLTQQEQVKQAMFNSVLRAESNLRAIENRFQEVFASSAIGISITDLDGMCIEANPALGEILGMPARQLAGRLLSDMFLDEGAGNVMAGLRQIREGGPPKVGERRKLRKDDGETAWVLLALSLLRDGAGNPAYFVAMVQDVTELQLLQDRLGHQLLYDALTGLPNRQNFLTKLESAFERAEPGSTITLCCLNLDDFAVLNNSRGHVVGDRLLQKVSRKLEAVVADENAVVARIGGDEFAVLIEDTATTPHIGELSGLLTAELTDAEYVDGDEGVAVGASVGAVRGRADEGTAAELFLAADTALRKAKATGRRQWSGFHDADDGAAVTWDRRATELPAAWENGELAVGYEPVVRLSDRVAVAARAVLTWAPDDEPVSHDELLRLAERTGLSVYLGPQILRDSSRDLPILLAALGAADTDGLLRVQLSRNQTADADLVRAVHHAVKESGLAASMLEVSLDTGAVLDGYGEAWDNLEVLGDIDVRVGLCGFTGGPRELALVSTARVTSVTLPGSAGRVDANPVLRDETARVVRMLDELGATCSVVDVRSEAEAEWWASVGAATAQGGLFGAPGAAADLFSSR
jgi:diguanylate cyclase (GGDEF)-like protein